MGGKKGTRTVVVTGAAGSVGGFIVGELLRVEDTRVVRVDRPGARLDPPDRAHRSRVEDRVGDLADPAFARACMRDADYVIHTAAVLDISMSYEELKPINVDAVGVLYEAAREENVRGFVHFSSGSIYQATDGLITEETPLKGDSAYEQSKIDSEALIRQLARKGGPGWVFLRPSLIYGPRGRMLGGLMPTLPPILKLMSGGTAMVGLSGGPKSNWVHAEDVARAAVFVMDNRDAYGEAYNVCDDTPLPFGEIIMAAIQAYGFPITTRIPIPPKWVARVALPVIDTDLFIKAVNMPASVLWKIVQRRHGLSGELTPKLDRAAVSYAVRDVVFSNAKLKRLGWTVKYPDIRTAYPDVLRWYQDNRWAPRYDKGSIVESLDVGFEFTETMSGTYRRTGDGASGGKNVGFTVTVTADSVQRFMRDQMTRIRGTLFMDEFADGVPIEGTLEIALFSGRRLVYEFEFHGADGASYRFHGRKEIDWLRFLDTITSMTGRVTDADGREVAVADMTFDLKNDLIPMLLSLRMVY